MLKALRVTILLLLEALRTTILLIIKTLRIAIILMLKVLRIAIILMLKVLRIAILLLRFKYEELTATPSSLITLTVVSMICGGTSVAARPSFGPYSNSAFTDPVGLKKFDSIHFRFLLMHFNLGWMNSIPQSSIGMAMMESCDKKQNIRNYANKKYDNYHTDLRITLNILEYICKSSFLSQ